MNKLDEIIRQLRCYQIEKNVVNHIKYELEMQKSNKEAVIESLKIQNEQFYKKIEKIKETRKNVIYCTIIYNLLLFIISVVGVVNPNLNNIYYILLTVPASTLLYLFTIYKDCVYLKNSSIPYVYSFIDKNKRDIFNLEKQIKKIEYDLAITNDRMNECNRNIDDCYYTQNLYSNNYLMVSNECDKIKKYSLNQDKVK